MTLVGFRVIVGLRGLLIAVGLNIVESIIYVVIADGCGKVGANSK